jgi:Ca-activated chloride channel family protein
MLRRIRDEADKQIALLGVGVGSEYGDKLMEQLADKGDGFVVYISERKQARDLFVHKLPATLACGPMTPRPRSSSTGRRSRRSTLSGTRTGS